jgi:hypothetical protein
MPDASFTVDGLGVPKKSALDAYISDNQVRFWYLNQAVGTS